MAEGIKNEMVHVVHDQLSRGWLDMGHPQLDIKIKHIIIRIRGLSGGSLAVAGSPTVGIMSARRERFTMLVVVCVTLDCNISIAM